MNLLAFITKSAGARLNPGAQTVSVEASLSASLCSASIGLASFLSHVMAKIPPSSTRPTSCQLGDPSENRITFSQ